MNAKGEITINEVGCPYCRTTQDLFVPVTIGPEGIGADDSVQICSNDECGKRFVLSVAFEDTIEVFTVGE